MKFAGYKFKTNTGANCRIIWNNFDQKYIIFNEDSYCVIATDTIYNMEKLILTIKRNF